MSGNLVLEKIQTNLWVNQTDESIVELMGRPNYVETAKFSLVEERLRGMLMAQMPDSFFDVENLDEIEIKISWTMGEHMFGGNYYQWYISMIQTVRSSDVIDLSEVADKFVLELELEKDFSLHHRTQESTLDNGLMLKCPDCRGLGYHSRYTNGGREYEIDCEECGGHSWRLVQNQDTSVVGV